MQLPAGTYNVQISGDTLSLTRVGDLTPAPATPAAPAIDYSAYHAALTQVRAARLAKGQGPNDDIDAFRLLVENPMDVAAVIARIDG